MGRECSNRIGGAGEVHVDLRVPVRVIHLEQWFEGLDAGIGEQDVDAPEFVFDAGAGRAECLEIPLVELDTEPAAIGRLDQSSRLLQIFRGRRLNAGTRTHDGANVDASDIGTLAGQSDGCGATDAAGGAGNHGNLAL
jgi:hypothetical protein